MEKWRWVMSTVFERVRKIIVQELHVDEKQVVPEAAFVADLGADSLSMVQFIMIMEEEFVRNGKPLDMTDEEAEKIVTVQDVLDYLKDHGFRDE
jgi:acyl carrier protein